MKLNNPCICAIEYYLPSKRLTNDELAELYGSSNMEKLSSKIGIHSRHVLDDNESISDLAVNAAQKLFSKNNISPDDIDFIIVCTQSPDYILPTTACIIQDRLALPTSCGALDFNLGCSGFIYGLALAKSLIRGYIAANVLLIMADAYTRYIHPMDKSIRPIFGDGAAAILISDRSDGGGIGQFVLGTDGSGAKNLIIPAGGLKLPKSEKTGVSSRDRFGNERSLNNLYMDGPEMYKFAVKLVPQLVDEIMNKNELSMEEIDLFVSHQASKYLLDSIRKNIGIPEEKFYINIENIGNTVGASIPIALKFAEEEKRLNKGDNVMLFGFGVGYSWGGTLIKW